MKERGFKKVVLALICAVVAMVVTPTMGLDNLEPSQRFALQLEVCQSAWANDTPSKCELYGKIQIVDSFPDVKIQAVDAFADIKVEWVDAFADSPGEWEEVDSFPDYKVQFVDAFPDYEVEFVDAFPGCD